MCELIFCNANRCQRMHRHKLCCCNSRTCAHSFYYCNFIYSLQRKQHNNYRFGRKHLFMEHRRNGCIHHRFSNRSSNNLFSECFHRHLRERYFYNHQCKSSSNSFHHCGRTNHFLSGRFSYTNGKSSCNFLLVG